MKLETPLTFWATSVNNTALRRASLSWATLTSRYQTPLNILLRTQGQDMYAVLPFTITCKSLQHFLAAEARASHSFPMETDSDRSYLNCRGTHQLCLTVLPYERFSVERLKAFTDRPLTRPTRWVNRHTSRFSVRKVDLSLGHQKRYR